MINLWRCYAEAPRYACAFSIGRKELMDFIKSCSPEAELDENHAEGWLTRMVLKEKNLCLSDIKRIEFTPVEYSIRKGY